MARFKMGNKSVVTQSGDDEPVVASNVDFSSATFPAGHIVSHATPYYDPSVPSDIETDQTSFQESGVEVSLTTKFSGSNSRIVCQFFSGYMRMSGNSAICYWTVGRGTGTGTAYSSATDLSDNTWNTVFYPDATGAYWSQGGLWVDTTHSASTTYYYQIYFRSNSGTTQLVRSDASVALNVYEVRIS